MIENEPQIDVNGKHYDLYIGLINSDDRLVKLKNLIDFSFAVPLLEQYYCDNNGRPAKNIIFMLKIMLLKHLECLSDRDLIRSINNDLAVKFFLNLNPEQRDVIDNTTLSKFRTLRLTPLIEFSKQENNVDVINAFIAESLRIAKSLGIDISKKIIMDSTHTASKYNYYSSIEIITELSKNLRRVIYQIDETYESIMPEKPNSNDIFEHINYGKQLLEAIVNNIPDIVEDMGVAGQRYRYFKEKIDEGIEAMNSLKDKDAKIGHKSEEKSFFGFKTHIAMNDDRIITAANITSGEASDSKNAIGLIENSKKNGIDVDTAIGDGAYSSSEIIRHCEQEDIKLVAKLSETIVNVKLPDGMIYNKDINNLTCAAGEVSIRKDKDHKISKNGEKIEYLRYIFDINKCKVCPKKDGCYNNTKSKSVKVRIGMTAIHQRHQAFQESDEAKQLTKLRYKIEAKNAELKNNYEYQKTCFNNIAGMEIQAVLTIFATNLLRIQKLYEQKSKK